MQISVAVEEAGYAADNVSYGMGGGLLQKLNRDTMSFATKLNHIVYAGKADWPCLRPCCCDVNVSTVARLHHHAMLSCPDLRAQSARF
jgi:hypothetical protein